MTVRSTSDLSDHSEETSTRQVIALLMVAIAVVLGYFMEKVGKGFVDTPKY